MEQEGWKGGRFGDCSELVIGACIRVHRELGPGLLESAYEACVARELSLRGLHFARQVPVPVRYRGVELDCCYRMDFVIERELVLELKAVDTILPVHLAQVVTYLKLTKLPAGLLVNFHCESLRRGLRRLRLK